jgi:ABC-type bacteriocin/lantibiotic exporter with double-glycine peptidase domain
MEKKSKDKTFTRFFRLLNVGKQEVISVYMYALFNGIIALSLPLGIQAIINLISAGQVSTSWVVLVILVIVGVALSGVMKIMQLSITENLQQKIFTKSAFEFAYRIPRLKLEQIDKYYIPELVNRFFDTLTVQKGLSKILMDFSRASLQVIFGLILLSLYHPFFILFSLLLVLMVYIILKLTAHKGLKTSLTESKYKYEVAHWLEELARTMETFKLAGNSPLPLGITDKAVEGYLVSRKAHFKTLLVQYISLVGFKVLITAGLLLIGGYLVINQQMNIGQFVASEIIIILVLSSVEKLITSMEVIYDVLVALEKIGSVTDIALDNDEHNVEEISSENGVKILLNDLSFGFQEETNMVLKNVNLKIMAGEKICLSGYYGAGKSLFLQILAGLYSEFKGVLTYNDKPISVLNKEHLRTIIGDSLSKEDLFKGTLEQNITLSKTNVSSENLNQIIEVVGLTEYIESLTRGIQTEIRPEGKNLPRNIRLRIMLARCLVGNPKIVLVEDNFNLLRDKVKESFLSHLLTCEATVVVVSNQSAIIERFDRVLVLDKGTLIIDGKPEELLNNKEYAELLQKS